MEKLLDRCSNAEVCLDRQTDRQTDIRIDNFTKRLADLVAMQKQTRGGQDRKYRKCRGIGEFNRQQKSTTVVGDFHEERQSNDGEYP